MAPTKKTTEEKPAHVSTPVKTTAEKKAGETVLVKHEFLGQYLESIGRRKRSSARVRLYQNGKGVILINHGKLEDYFTPAMVVALNQSLKLTGRGKDLDFSILVKGGGKKCQAESACLGISRGLVMMEKEIRPSLKAKRLLTRDAREKERKKPGLKKARRAPQWAKR
jgi:small subunit ribosomal protein S9